MATKSGSKKLTDVEFNEAMERLGDNFMGDGKLDDTVMSIMYEDGDTPESISGTPEDKAEYAAYYAIRKAKGD